MADRRRCAPIRQASLRGDAESHDGSLTRFRGRSCVHDGPRAQQRHCIRCFLRAPLTGKPLSFRTILPPGELTPNRSSCSTSTVPNGCVFVASLLGLLSSNLSVWADAGPYLLRVRTVVAENLACFISLTLSSAGSVIKSTSYYVRKVRPGRSFFCSWFRLHRCLLETPCPASLWMFSCSPPTWGTNTSRVPCPPPAVRCTGASPVHRAPARPSSR